jgi:hypothetical protein
MRHVSIAQLLISHGADKDTPGEDVSVIRYMIFDKAPTFLSLRTARLLCWPLVVETKPSCDAFSMQEQIFIALTM